MPCRQRRCNGIPGYRQVGQPQQVRPVRRAGARRPCRCRRRCKTVSASPASASSPAWALATSTIIDRVASIQLLQGHVNLDPVDPSTTSRPSRLRRRPCRRSRSAREGTQVPTVLCRRFRADEHDVHGGAGCRCARAGGLVTPRPARWLRLRHHHLLAAAQGLGHGEDRFLIGSPTSPLTVTTPMDQVSTSRSTRSFSAAPSARSADPFLPPPAAPIRGRFEASSAAKSVFGRIVWPATGSDRYGAAACQLLRAPDEETVGDLAGPAAPR